MRTRKMRFVSALLAVAMMFVMLPVGAFAAEDTASDVPVEVKGLEILPNGRANVPLEAPSDDTSETYIYVDGVKITRKYKKTESGRKVYTCTGVGWEAAIYEGDDYANNFQINPNATWAGSDTKVMGTFDNFGTLTGGTFQYIGNYNNGVIEDCYADTLRNGFNVQGGTVNGGTFGKLSAPKEGTAGVINNAVFGQVDNLSEYHTLIAQGLTINQYLHDTAYVVGKPTITISFADSRNKIKNWLVNGEVVNSSNLPGAVLKHDNANATLTFEMPTKDIEISVEKVKTPLEIKNGLPVDEMGQYSGSPFDGWTYNDQDFTDETDADMVIEDWYTADLKNNTVNWNITNNGALENGTITNPVTNNGTVENITATSYFYNNGVIKSGVFSRYAGLGAQKDSACWVAVNGGKANGMQTAGVVGTQTVEVKANTSADNPFEGWTYSGDVSDAVAEQIEAQKNNETMLLTLNGNDGGTMVLTAKYSKDAFALTMLDGKATVDGANVTAAVPGQTVTLSIDDSEIPEGMSFDHWVISLDVELEGGFKATNRTTSFTMPAQELTIYASLRTDSDDGTDAMTIVAGVAIGAGAAVLTYHIGTELYAKQVLGDGVAIPRTRENVALKAWELAGKPAVELNGEPLSETAQAEKWAVESGLMQNDANGEFNGAKKMSKLKALRTLDAAKKLG